MSSIPYAARGFKKKLTRIVQGPYNI
jgi:hypothetical protein